MRAFSPVDETDALAPHGFEPCELDVEPVVAGRQARGGVDAVASGNGDSLTDSSVSR